MKTTLSLEDRGLLFSARWALVQARKGGNNAPAYCDDALDALTEVLDVDLPSHVDADLLPDTKGTSSEVKIEEETLNGSRSPGPTGFKLYAAIGHNKETGSQSFDGRDEWETSRLVAERMKVLAPRYGIEVMIGVRNRSKGYGDAMREHGDRADKFGSMLNVEIHRNAFDGEAKGIEFIVASDAGAAAGRFFASANSKFYPDAPLRGEGGLRDRRKGGRGAGFCRAGKAPSVVLEPCFHDAKGDWERIRDDVDKEARTILAAAKAAIMFGKEKVPSLSAAGEFFDQVFPTGALSV